MPDQPTLVFIPGSWHKPTCYNKVAEPLRSKHGFTCISITLPSTKGDAEAIFKDDIDAARDVIVAQIEQGHNVVVIAHSYGGMVGNSAIKGLTPSKRSTSATDEKHVIGMILIASGFTITGLAFMDPLFGIPPPSWRKNETTGFAELVTAPRKLFYHDLPPEQSDFWVSQLTPQSLKSLFEGGEYAYAGWKDVPVWYIGTAQDQALPAWLQRVQVGMARGQGGEVTHRELNSSHSPFLSRVNDVVEITIEAVKEFQDRSNRTATELTRRRRGLLLRLWPHKWYRYGIPMGIGEFIGSCVYGIDLARRFWSKGICAFRE